MTHVYVQSSRPVFCRYLIIFCVFNKSYIMTFVHFEKIRESDNLHLRNFARKLGEVCFVVEHECRRRKFQKIREVGQCNLFSKRQSRSTLLAGIIVDRILFFLLKSKGNLHFSQQRPKICCELTRREQLTFSKEFTLDDQGTCVTKKRWKFPKINASCFKRRMIRI